MDVERLKKINKLSVELKKHGIAECSMDAVKKAEEYIPEKEMRETMKKTREFAENTEATSMDSQYQVLLERQNRKLGQEIQRLAELIMEMNSEIELMKSEIVQMKKAGVSRVVEQKPKVEKQASLKKEIKKETKEAHPRQGNYTPDDVSIEKMFYCGNK